MDELVSHHKRKGQRISYTGTVRFSADQFNWYLNKAQDISKNGIFIETIEAFKPGTKLYLNFDLTIGPDVVKKIRTRGEVVRVSNGERKSSGNESTGIGLQFSLLPDQEHALRSFVKSVVDDGIAELISPAPSPAKQVCVKIQGTTDSSLRWWFEDAVNRVYNTNGVILELAVILIFIVLGIMIFK